MPSDATPTAPHTAWLEVPSQVLAVMYAHARATYPEECCGFLLGPHDRAMVDEVRRCVNEQDRYHALDPERFPRTARHGYYLGGTDLRFLLTSLDSPRPVKVVYHSHPNAGAFFSAEDICGALGRDPDATTEPQYPVDYIVIATQADHIAEAKGFCWDPSQRTFVQVATFPGERAGAS